MAGYRSLLAAIEACAPEDDQQHLIWRRRAYVWRKLSKILPDGPGSSRGTGARKRYAAAAIPRMAVLLRISDKFPATEELDAISRALEQNLTANPTFSRRWAAALAEAEAWSQDIKKKLSNVDWKQFPEYVRSMTQSENTYQDKEEEQTKDQGRTYLTIAFPTPVRGDFTVRCGNAPIMTPDDLDIYVLDLGFVFERMFEPGLF
jgi:hypothetical protein